EMTRHESLQQLQQAMKDALTSQRSQQQEALREALRELFDEQKEAIQELADSLSTKHAELSSLLEEAAQQLNEGTMSEQTSQQLANELSELLAAAEASSMLSQWGDRMAQ